MNKKFTAILALAMVLSLASCGNEIDSEVSVTLDLPVADVSEDTTTEEQETTTLSETTDTPDSTDTASVSTEPEVTTEVTTIAEDNSTEEIPAEEPQEQGNEDPVDNAGTSDPEPQEPEPEPTEAPAQTTVYFSMDILGGNADSIISSLGDATDIIDATGCLENGLDQRIYMYDGIRISCYISDGTPYIYDAEITSGNYSTSMGITVGSSRSDVENAYGVPAESGSFVRYADNNKEMSILYEGDTVSSIIFHLTL